MNRILMLPITLPLRVLALELRLARGAAGVHRVNSRGRTTVERVFSLVLLGDLVSLYLAILRGVDPEPVELLDALKSELARAG